MIHINRNYIQIEKNDNKLAHRELLHFKIKKNIHV